ncbi:hypothetical protein SUGI_0088730 [Cryptomeria japonica]|nr:hypothetical protein SUGI_0088730 [Cryptomeria japonica]
MGCDSGKSIGDSNKIPMEQNESSGMVPLVEKIESPGMEDRSQPEECLSARAPTEKWGSTKKEETTTAYSRLAMGFWAILHILQWSRHTMMSKWLRDANSDSPPPHNDGLRAKSIGGRRVWNTMHKQQKNDVLKQEHVDGEGWIGDFSKATRDWIDRTFPRFLAKSRTDAKIDNRVLEPYFGGGGADLPRSSWLFCSGV